MKKLLSVLGIVLSVCFPAMAELVVHPTVAIGDRGMPYHLGGGGGAYFYGGGNFRINVFVQTGPRPVRVVFFSPDREVLLDTLVPATARGKGSHLIRLDGRDMPEGIYALTLISPNDQYGEIFTWAVETDKLKYVIEISRAHRDSRHVEPIVLKSPHRAGEICFPVQKGAFTIDLSKCVPNSKIRVLDNNGNLVASATADAQGNARISVAADPERTGLYRLAFERYSGVVEIDELTRWAHVRGGEDSSFAAQWTPRAGSYFRFGEVRAMLRPFYREIWVASGTAQFPLTLKNNSTSGMTVELSAEYPDGAAPFISFAETRVYIPPRQSRQVMVTCSADADKVKRSARIRAGALGISTYSTVVMNPTAEPDGKEISMPLVMTPYRNYDDYGIRAWTPQGEPYFDAEGRRYCIDIVNGFFHFYYFDNGVWHEGKMADGSDIPRPLSTKIATDANGRVYFLASFDRKTPKLLWSKDHGRTFEAVDFPVPATNADIEVFTGHNPGTTPPPILLFNKTSGRTAATFWRQTNDVTLLIPEERDGKIVFTHMVPVTDKCIGISLHSGMAHSLVSTPGKVHIAWGEASDPNDRSIKGVPTYVATFDRATGKLSTPVLVGFGPPANDIHNTPSIISDSKGFLHLFIGAHGSTFFYSRSLNPASGAQWTPAATLGGQRGMTYAGAVCDQNDILHLVYRQTAIDEVRFPRGYYIVLSELTKPAAADQWSAPRVLVAPFFSDYSVYYHKLTISPQGRIWLSLQSYTTFWFYRNDFATTRRLIYSDNGGQTWMVP